MGARILVIQGHPDATHPHLCHALADAYAQGAVAAGGETQLSVEKITKVTKWIAFEIFSSTIEEQKISGARHVEDSDINCGT